MLFNTATYGVFLIVALAAFWSLRRHRRARHLMLLGASYVFYAAWSFKYLGLLIFTTGLDFFLALAIDGAPTPARRRLWVTVSVVSNLGVLGVFKYYGFFAESLAALGMHFGVRLPLPVLHMVLPVGISFYTFQSLSYTLDVYRRRLAPTRSLLEFALVVAFFPHMVAGPIMRAAIFLPQFERPPALSEHDIGSALHRILIGLAKKILIADYLGAHLVDAVFARPTAFGGADVLLATYAYALQIYGDFSGYSDIAIGSARLFGFVLPENFSAPYRAVGLRDFWRRWHITLSTWLRDYLYISLGGDRGGKLRTAVNVMLTMLLGGLWHGAAWTFVAWGGLHGAGLLLERFALRMPDSRLGRLLCGLVTFHVVCAGWLLFRSHDFAAALDAFAAFGRWSAPSLLSSGVVAVLLIGFATHLAPVRIAERVRSGFVRLPAVAQAAALVLALALFESMSLTNQPFIYFQF